MLGFTLLSRRTAGSTCRCRNWTAPLSRIRGNPSAPKKVGKNLKIQSWLTGVENARFTSKFAVEVVTQARASNRLPPLVHHPFSGIVGENQPASSADSRQDKVHASFEVETGVLSACQVAKLPRSSDHRVANKLDSALLRDSRKLTTTLCAQGLLSPELAAETVKSVPSTL